MAVALAGRGARGGRGRPPGGRAEGAGPGRRAARATAAAKTTETGGAGADDSGRARGGAVPAAVRQRPGLPRSAVPKGERSALPNGQRPRPGSGEKRRRGGGSWSNECGGQWARTSGRPARRGGKLSGNSWDRGTREECLRRSAPSLGKSEKLAALGISVGETLSGTCARGPELAERGFTPTFLAAGSCRAGLRTSGFGGSSMHWPRLASNPVSTSRVLGLQMCTTMLGIFSAGD
ncbi:dynein light chain Tctex-type protein 2 isoform X2 [Mus musculus]|uniref:dynein light chain Tctex-type protein 2 isoform X2 n=1 Tax=Mus musculus TaxID=10090 RepID=UPI0011AE2FF1|nr:dynein light chain Tctex-type protein 2 isoform X2 [Mus musculus]